MGKKTEHFVRKIRDVRVNRVENRRIDVSIPPEILERAGVKVGDSVEIRVTADKRIVLMPLRSRWPRPCLTRTEGCLLASGHAGGCVLERDGGIEGEGE